MAVSEVGLGECLHSARLRSHRTISERNKPTVGVLTSGIYSESTLSDWLANAPRHLLANNYGLFESRGNGRESSIIAEAGWTQARAGVRIRRSPRVLKPGAPSGRRKRFLMVRAARSRNQAQVPGQRLQPFPRRPEVSTVSIILSVAPINVLARLFFRATELRW